MTTTRTTNLAMAMRLPATDPHSILYTNTWGKRDRECEYLGTENTDIPIEDNLEEVQNLLYQALDFGEETTVLPDEASRMLVREDYEELHELIEKDRHAPGHDLSGMVVTGHPGIGKSFFLFYYLFKNLLAAQPTAFQTDKSSFLLFVEDGVYLIRFSSNTSIYDLQSQLRNLGCKKGVMALVDSSEKSPSPAPVFTDSRFPFYVIQAAAPRSSRWADWLEQRSGSVMVMKPCSWAEVCIIGTKFTKRDLTAKGLCSIYEQYGPSARLCLNLADDDRRTELYDLELQIQLSACPSVGQAAKSYRISENPGNFKRLESFLLMIPSASRLPLVSLTSRPLAKLISARGDKELYQQLESNPETRERARDMWEAAMQPFFTVAGTAFSCSYAPISPTPAGKELLKCSYDHMGPLPRFVHLNKTGIYTCKGLQTCSAVGYTPPTSYLSRQSQLLLFRICRDGKAPIHTKELDTLTKLLPKDATPWSLVFVIPPGLKDTFSLQPFIGEGDSSWESGGKIVQCVAVMDV